MKICDLFKDVAGLEVSYSEFNFELPFYIQEYEDELKEDLFQGNYGKYTIDLGWYPSFDISGEFRAYVVESGDWGRPLLQKGFTDLFEAVEAVKEIITKISR